MTTDIRGAIHEIPVLDMSDPAFARVARPVPFPPPGAAGTTNFFPALSTFRIPPGDTVDVSVLSMEPPAPHAGRGPLRGFDRHVQTEELFVALEGDFIFPAAPARATPPDPDELPEHADLAAFVIRQGQAFVLQANTWHSGGWPVDPGRRVTFLMILSGHRAGNGQEHIDWAVRHLPGGAGVVPRFEATA